MLEDLLTVRQVAERLQVNEQTVRNWIIAGQLAETRVGPRRVRIAESEVARFLKLQETASRAAVARPKERKRRRASTSDIEAVEDVVELMITVAAKLPVDSPLARELAESAGRLQLALRIPGKADSTLLRRADQQTGPASSEEWEAPVG